ncbi:MAG: hypothetical protein P1V51_05555 [Deltaproteobacteria bacterium]|nr:hypothetical protein [Deltaproteobacteria bacterium]
MKNWPGILFALSLLFSTACPREDEGPCEAGRELCGSICVDLQTDSAHCGACGEVCSAPETCGAGSCQRLCAGDEVLCEGACIDPLTDLAHCGASGDCSGASAGLTCGAGELCDGAGACAPTCAAGRVLCGGACIDPATDRDHCGASGDCSGASAGLTCAAGELCDGAGACAATCQAGMIVCGGQCVDPAVDERYCGATNCAGGVGGVACAPGERCLSGLCEPSCPAGQLACDGACIDPLTDRTHCGASDCAGGAAGVDCAPDGVCDGTGSCSTVCAGSLLLCGDQCIDPATDERYCGASGNCLDVAMGEVCGASERCESGTCTPVGACPAGQLLCGGFCVDPLTDRTYCGATDCAGGAAGITCPAGMVCDGTGLCRLECRVDLVACEGVCIDPLTDRAHCGATGDCLGANAGAACPAGTVCDGTGQCLAVCAGGRVSCGGQCVDPLLDAQYCGALGSCSGASAGTNCSALGEVCDGTGQCATTCQGGAIACDGTCVDASTDTRYCGASGACGPGERGEVCDPGEVCQSGVCILDCPAGLVGCGGSCIDPDQDETYCGATFDCAGPNDGTDCAALGEICDGRGACAASCGAGLSPCGDLCVDHLTDPDYCGDCSTVCTGGVGEVVWCDGTCQSGCAADYDECDGDPAVPCEAHLPDDPNNCGGCNVVCDSGHCIAGQCTGLVFITSTQYTGNLGGVSGANQKCQQHAVNAGLPGTYKAWISGTGYSPGTQLRQWTAPIVLRDGTVVVNDWPDLLDSSISHGIDQDELGNPGPAMSSPGCGHAYTGTWPSGGAVSATWRCAEWTADTGQASVWGRSDLTNFGWTQWCSGGSCAYLASLYCFLQ